MAIVNQIVALIGLFAVGVCGVAPYSNVLSTETAAPQEIGSVTSAGILVYSLNMCTIVHSTNCQVTMSTGGPAPSASKPSYIAPGPGSAVSKPANTPSTTLSTSAPSQTPSPATSSSVSMPTPLATTSSPASPPALTHLASTSPTGSSATKSQQKSPPATAYSPAPTSAATTIVAGSMHYALFGALVLGISLLF